MQPFYLPQNGSHQTTTMVWDYLPKSKIFDFGWIEFFVILISGSLWVSYLWTPLLFLWRLNVMSTNKKLSISMSVGSSSTFSSFTFLDLTCIDTDSELLSVLGTVGTYILVWNIRNWYIFKISRIGFFVFFSRKVFDSKLQWSDSLFRFDQKL